MNSGGGIGKTMRVIELFLVRYPFVFTLILCLTKEMRTKEVKEWTIPHGMARMTEHQTIWARSSS